MDSSTLLRWDNPEATAVTGQYTDSAESSQAKEHVMMSNSLCQILVASKREETFSHVRRKLNKVTRTKMGLIKGSA